MNTAAANEAALSAQLDMHFPPTRYRACAVRPRAFLVSATKADGTTETWRRVGGNTTDHALEAQERAGLGGVVRVQPLDHQEAA